MRMKKIKSGFTLAEAIAAVMVLGLITSSVLIVFRRCSSGSLDSMRKMQAFEVTRENMENLLTENTFSEESEYGYSEKYPHIEWTTKIETFYEPVYKKMWVRAVCSAQYEDSDGEVQTVEFSNWLTKLDEKQAKKVLDAKNKLKELYDEFFNEEPNDIYPEEPNGLFMKDPNR